jgi:hypothetical protein
VALQFCCGGTISRTLRTKGKMMRRETFSMFVLCASMVNLSYVGRVNYVVSLVDSYLLTIDRRSEDLGETTIGYERICVHFYFFCLAVA